MVEDKDVAVSVVVLQPLAGERRASRGAADEEASRACMSPAAHARSPMRWNPNIE